MSFINTVSYKFFIAYFTLTGLWAAWSYHIMALLVACFAILYLFHQRDKANKGLLSLIGLSHLILILMSLVLL